MFEGLYP